MNSNADELIKWPQFANATSLDLRAVKNARNTCNPGDDTSSSGSACDLIAELQRVPEDDRKQPVAASLQQLPQQSSIKRSATAPGPLPELICRPTVVSQQQRIFPVVQLGISAVVKTPPIQNRPATESLVSKDVKVSKILLVSVGRLPRDAHCLSTLHPFASRL